MNNGVVIVGGSLAGYNVAKGLRKEGYEGKITVVTEQNVLPYDPKVLSKDWMIDSETMDPPVFQNEDFFTKSKIDMKLNTKVTDLNPEEKTVQTNTEEVLPYDKLVLATGSTLRTLNIPGSDASGVFYLRDFDNALAIKNWSQKAKELVIVGGGFIGLEMASTFSQLGMNVTVVELENYPLGRILGEDVSKYFMKMHQAHGVEFITGEAVASLNQDEQGNVKSAVTRDGKEIHAEMVIIGIGVTPNTTLTHPDLEVDRGYVVNEYGETSLDDVYAAGDSAMWPYQDKLVHVEHWEHAFYHGQAIAKNIMQPRSKPYTERPYFWTDQYDQTFEYLGQAINWHKTITRGSLLDDKQFTVAYVDENNYPLAILFANKSEKRKDVAKLMDGGKPIDEDSFKNVDNPLI